MGTFFTVGAVEDPPALLLTAGDDLDLSTVVRVREELLSAARREVTPAVVVDVTGCFVGARGMSVLVDAVVRSQQSGQALIVAGLTSPLLQRLALFDAEGLPFFGRLDDALGAVPRGRDAQASG